jgi:hypothetical protein
MANKDLAKQILDLKADLEEDEKEFIRKQTELDVLLNRLKTEFKMEDVVKATKWCENEKRYIEKQQTELERLLDELEKEYVFE